jgi:hypothetical protein
MGVQYSCSSMFEVHCKTGCIEFLEGLKCMEFQKQINFANDDVPEDQGQMGNVGA